MNRPISLCLIALGLALTMAGCKKQTDEPTPADPIAPSPSSSAPSAPAATEPDALTPEQIAAAEKQKAIERALANQKIVEDPKGQWASSAITSSTYAALFDDRKENDWKAVAAIGAPDAEGSHSDRQGWSPEKEDAGIEWLELGFDRPVTASALRVRQISSPGAIIKVELIDETGAKHTAWEGRDDSLYESGQINWFEKTFDPTAYKAKGVRLTLATNSVDGRENIDAVQLIGE